MIPVEQITEQELEKRFDLLPQKLQDALASKANVQIANQICGSNHIPDEEKRLIVQQIIGLAILGFVHYYDVGSEIADAAGLDKRVASQVAHELEVKIFNPIKTELESNYRPLVVSDGKTSTRPAEKPKIVEEIKAPGIGISRTAPAQPAEVKPIDISKIFGARPSIAQEAKPPSVLLDSAKAKPGGEIQSPTKPPASPPPSKSEAKEQASEFARLGIGTEAETKAAEAPKILYKETEVKPGPASGFRIAPPLPKFSEVRVSKPPPAPARVEFPSFDKVPEGNPFFGKTSADVKALADKPDSKIEAPIATPKPPAGPPIMPQRTPPTFGPPEASLAKGGQKPEIEFRPFDTAHGKPPSPPKTPITPPDLTPKPTKPISDLGPRIVNYADMRTPISPISPKPIMPAPPPRKAAEGTAPPPKPEIKTPLLGDEKTMHPSFAAYSPPSEVELLRRTGAEAAAKAGKATESKPFASTQDKPASMPPAERPRIEPPPIRKAEPPPPKPSG